MADKANKKDSSTKEEKRFYYAMLDKDTFDKTAWRIIQSERHPIPEYAKAIYITLILEATPYNGTLLRKPNTPYEIWQLMALMNIRDTERGTDAKMFRKAYSLLQSEGLIEVDKGGAIKVVEPKGTKIWGSRSLRTNYRISGTSTEDGSENPLPTSENGSENPSSIQNPKSDDGIDNEGDKMSPISGQNGKTDVSPYNNDSNNNPLKSYKDEEIKKHASSQKIDDDYISQFLKIYGKRPKPGKEDELKTTISNFTDFQKEALLIAAERERLSKEQANDSLQTLSPPEVFAASLPWTKAEYTRATIRVMDNRVRSEGGSDGN